MTEDPKRKKPQIPIRKNEVIEELKLCDPLDKIILLSIGPKETSHLGVQKRALLISRILAVDSEAEPYKYGLYSETITEKLQNGRNEFFINRRNNKYLLTPEGLYAYQVLLERLKARDKKDIASFIETLHQIDEMDLLALAYHLFPESFKESEIKEIALRTIKRHKKKEFVRAKKEGEKIIIKVMA